MTEDPKKQWLASHIFCGGSLDKVIFDAILPFIQKVRDLGIAEQFFFIRYWEKGPHVRLRFFTESDKIEKDLKPLYKSYFDQYFVENPSVREVPAYVGELPEEDKWFPNDSVQFLEYEPEVERYGGVEAMAYSEEHFRFSSETVLELMEEGKDQWGYDLAMGAAIQMHLSMAHGLGMKTNEMIAFFDRYFARWLSRAYFSYGQKLSEEDLKKRQEDTLSAFESSYETQKDSFTSFFTQIQEILNHQDLADTWMEKWVEGAKYIADQLDDLVARNAYQATKFYEITDDPVFSKETQSKWALFDSYIHMTNNRLGVLNRDEAYLAYIISKTLKSTWK